MLFSTTPGEIIQVVNQMQAKQSAGFDDIPLDIMKLSTSYVAKPLTAIINNSFRNGSFPDTLKIAKVCPVYKNGDTSELTNYRPISVLTSFSKIFERLVYNRLTNYLNKYAIIYENQFGFRSNLSTVLAVP